MFCAMCAVTSRSCNGEPTGTGDGVADSDGDPCSDTLSMLEIVKVIVTVMPLN